MSEAQPDARPDAPRSTIDLACGELGYVDLTFPGLDALPAAGEERHAADFLRSPGGGAITAIGAARLGLATALVSPIGADADGDFLRAALAAEGVRWAGRKVARTAVTVVLPADGDRAMATFEPGEQLTAGELAAVAPRAVVLSLPRLGAAPPDKDLPGLERAHALLVNDHEALVLTGAGDVREAARMLARHAPRVVVTLGPEGALELTGDELVEAHGVPFEAVDTTGAGDLFTAAYAWADLNGAGAVERLRWAVLYASLSVRVPTAVGGASSLETLLEEGVRSGLEPPARHDSVAIEEEAR
jgi:ribokinase